MPSWVLCPFWGFRPGIGKSLNSKSSIRMSENPGSQTALQLQKPVRPTTRNDLETPRNEKKVEVGGPPEVGVEVRAARSVHRTVHRHVGATSINAVFGHSTGPQCSFTIIEFNPHRPRAYCHSHSARPTVHPTPVPHYLHTDITKGKKQSKKTEEIGTIIRDGWVRNT